MVKNQYMKRLFVIVFFSVFMVSNMNAQSSYDKKWAEIDQMSHKGLYNKAYPQALSLFEKAKSERNSRQMLTAAFEMHRLASAYMENANDSALVRYQSILPLLDEVDASLCHAFIAHCYHGFLDYVEAEEVVAEAEVEENSDDFRFWSYSKLDSVVASHIAASIANARLLQSVDVYSVRRFCDTTDENRLLVTPTLYDLLVLNATDYVNDYWQGVRYYELLRSFHLHDDDAIRIFIDHQQLELCYEEEIQRVFEPLAKEYLEKYRHTDCPFVTDIHAEYAEWLHDQGRFVEAKAVCDEALRMFPKSQGGVRCDNLRKRIVEPMVELNLECEQMANRDILTVASCRNVDRLYFRIIPSSNKLKNKKAYLNAKVLKSWSQSVEKRDDYKEAQSYCYLPPMPEGEYCLLVSTSSDFDSSGFISRPFWCDDVSFMVLDNHKDSFSGYLVNKKTGHPLPGIVVSIVNGNNVIDRSTTDAEGFFKFKKHFGNFYAARLECTYNGHLVSSDVYANSRTQATSKRHVTAFFDRPVYRPGDTVHFSLLCYDSDGKRVGNVVPGFHLRCEVRDINYLGVDTLELETDESGSVSGQWVLGDEAVPGMYHVKVTADRPYGSLGDFPFSVEIYKQPKFVVNLDADSRPHRYGDSIEVKGVAASYSGVPLSGAKATWSVERSAYYPWWGWRYAKSLRNHSSEIVASGETELDAQGTFSIGFVPMPDSSDAARLAPGYTFRVVANVTDLNGETHSKTLDVNVGDRDGYLALVGDEHIRSFDEVGVAFRSLDGNMLDGRLLVEVERLNPPAVPLLSHPFALKGLSHTIPETDFARRFPLMAYHPTDLDPSSWPSEKVLSYTMEVNQSQSTPSQQMNNPVTEGTSMNPMMRADGSYALSLPRLPEGCYRVKVSRAESAEDKSTAEQLFYLTPEGARSTPSRELLWSDIDKSKAEVGEKVSIRLSSNFEDVVAFYAMKYAGDSVQNRVIPIEKGIKTIEIPVTEQMLGGFDVHIFSTKENILCEKKYHIDVPYSHKKLDVKFVSFRDKLLPGEHEVWTLQVSEPQAFGSTAPLDGKSRLSAGASMVMTMYDAALNTFGDNSFAFFPWFPRSYSVFQWRVSSHSVYANSFDCWSIPQETRYMGPYLSAWKLMETYGQKLTIRYESLMGTKDCSVPVMAMQKSSARANAMMDGFEEAAPLDLATVVVTEESETMEPLPDAGEADEVQVRDDLRTLAFFYPSLKVGKDGLLSVSFTVPEALTQWAVKGVAWTPDLKVGGIVGSLLTQKPLMVVPNIPRFARHGDRVVIATKVANTTDEPLRVQYRLELSDGASGKVFFDSVLPVDISPKQNAIVSMPVVVPADVYVANYKVVASASSCSDGEQGCFPVLSNRQLVTESVAMYVNGKESRTFQLPHLLAANPDSLKANTQFFGVDFVSTPLWYAIESLPYFTKIQNPSNIYRFNSLFSNSLALHIVETNPVIERQLRAWHDYDSAGKGKDLSLGKLSLNEQVKQTLLTETPWLQEAMSESERRQAISVYFDSPSLHVQLEKDEKEIERQQHFDGGWSWMPNWDKSNEYVTRYILKMNGRLSKAIGGGLSRHSLSRALDYVDKCNYANYQKIKKNNHECLSENIDYLYARSFYADRDFAFNYRQAYDAYYALALKKARNEQYADYPLYVQAELALIFYRHGDVKEAERLVERIKGSALYSDEMGMYWRDNVSGYFWHQRPVEVQSLLIEAFSTIVPDDRLSVDKMRQWLLKQKQTTDWGNDVATISAIMALVDGSNLEAPVGGDMHISVGDRQVPFTDSSIVDYQARWAGCEVTPEMGRVSVSKAGDGVAWGALYWQYFEELDKIKYNEMGIKLQRRIYRVEENGKLVEYNGSNLKVGDRVRVKILIDCDRDLEYLELIDGRAAAFEPVSTASGWCWSNGLAYYVAVENAATKCFIDYMGKGKYVVEYELWANNAGTFVNGITSMQCLYAPEFRSNTSGGIVTVNP